MFYSFMFTPQAYEPTVLPHVHLCCLSRPTPHPPASSFYPQWLFNMYDVTRIHDRAENLGEKIIELLFIILITMLTRSVSGGSWKTRPSSCRLYPHMHLNDNQFDKYCTIDIAAQVSACYLGLFLPLPIPVLKPNVTHQCSVGECHAGHPRECMGRNQRKRC